MQTARNRLFLFVGAIASQQCSAIFASASAQCPADT
jgi:hypothetical protein